MVVEFGRRRIQLLVFQWDHTAVTFIDDFCNLIKVSLINANVSIETQNIEQSIRYFTHLVFIPSVSQSIYAHNIEVEEACEGTNCGLAALKRFNFIGSGGVGCEGGG